MSSDQADNNNNNNNDDDVENSSNINNDYNKNEKNAKFRCGFAGCGFHTNRLSDMCDHTLQVDHRSLHAWRCGVNNCETIFRSQRHLAQHRHDRHAVPPPILAINCGAHPQKTFCIKGMCRGVALDDVVELVRRIDLEQCDIEQQAARVRSLVRTPQVGAMVRPLPRFDHLLQHLINAVVEHDWPRPPPADGVCAACLQSYEQHAGVR